MGIALRMDVDLVRIMSIVLLVVDLIRIIGIVLRMADVIRIMGIVYDARLISLCRIFRKCIRKKEISLLHI